MAEILGNLVGGIGLFFVGLRMITAGLKQMAGRRLRRLFARWTGTGWRAGLIGVFSGLISQSGSTASFIVASLVSTGVTTVRSALPVQFWANGGSSLMVLVAVLDLKLLILLILGLAGVYLAFERSLRFHALANTLFGVGLLFYGLVLIRAGAAPLAQMSWFEAALLNVQGSYALSFLISALLTALSQSSAAVSILAITFTQAGLFSVEQALMMIYGANTGASTITYLLASRLEGRPKQLIMAQVLFNLVTAAVFVPLFYLEVYGQVPLVKALVAATGAPVQFQMAYVYLLFNWSGAIALSFFVEPLARFLERLWPQTQEEAWAEMRYLHDEALKDPETALTLLSREQTRLLGQVPLYLQELRKVIAGHGNPAYHSIHSAFATVSREIASFTTELFRQENTTAVSERALIFQNRQKLLEGLEEVLRELTSDLHRWVLLGESASVRDMFLEGTDTLLMSACDAADSPTIGDVELLLKMTHDRSGLLKQMRQSYMAKESSLSPEGRQLFLSITGRFETAVWLLNRLAQLQRQDLMSS